MVSFKPIIFYTWQPEWHEKHRRKQSEGRNVRLGKLIQIEIKNLSTRGNSYFNILLRTANLEWYNL